jgi:rRNA biogenesis protein RRP5
LAESFAVGQVVKVRITSVDIEASRIVASIRQAALNFKLAVTDISTIEIGNIVKGVVTHIHKENAILALQPSEARALISLTNLANHRSAFVPELRRSLQVGHKLEDLVVVSRNPEKGFVIVANRPKAKASLAPKSALSMNTIALGQVVGGRVTRHGHYGAFVKLSSHLGGTLHPTDISDDYDAGVSFPSIDYVLKAMVIDIDQAKKHLALSMRGSRIFPEQNRPVVDREINGVGDLNIGETIRGFIKSVSEHGLFITLGRGVDARVQIKELFDEVGRIFLLPLCNRIDRWVSW